MPHGCWVSADLLRAESEVSGISLLARFIVPPTTSPKSPEVSTIVEDVVFLAATSPSLALLSSGPGRRLWATAPTVWQSKATRS